VHNRVVALEEAVTQDDLNSIRNYMNRNFAGWTLDEVRRELRLRLEQESAACDAILKKLTLLYNSGLLDLGTEAEVHTEGVSNLLGINLHLTQEKMRELFRALEEKQRILDLLEQFLAEPDGELAVRVGLGDAHPSMGELSLIGVTVTLPSGLSAKIAVLGPVRMNYPKVMSTVLHVGQALQSLPS
jgi:heat-inducible transcriptional repressor